MNTLKSKIILLVILLVLIALIVFYAIFSGRKTVISDDVVGNTAGNLINNGLVCECDNEIYFSNPYDGGSLYKMNSDLSNIRKVNGLCADYINVGGEYVFFHGKDGKGASGLGSIVSKPAMYKVKKSGKALMTLTKDTSQEMVLVGNNLFYLSYEKNNGASFSCLNLSDKSNEVLLNEYIIPTCVYDKNIYYNSNKNDHKLYCFDTSSRQSTLVWDNEVWNPIYDGTYIYYMDIMNNYRLCRYDVSQNVIEILTNDRVDTYNINNDVIFYQKNDSHNPQLIRMNADGSNPQIIADGNYTAIGMTSDYTFFYEYGASIPIYYVQNDGPFDVKEFTAALDAVKTK